MENESVFDSKVLYNFLLSHVNFVFPIFFFIIKQRSQKYIYFLFLKECKIIFFQNRSHLKEYYAFLARCTSFPSLHMKPYIGHNMHASQACLKPSRILWGPLALFINYNTDRYHMCVHQWQKICILASCTISIPFCPIQTSP